KSGVESRAVVARVGDKSVRIVSIPLRPLELHVIDAETREPVQVFWYSVLESWTPSAYTPAVSWPAASKEGVVNSQSLWPAANEIAVWAPGYAIARKRIEVPETRGPVSIVMALEHGVTLTVRAFDADKASHGVPHSKIRFVSRNFGIWDVEWPLT